MWYNCYCKDQMASRELHKSLLLPSTPSRCIDIPCCSSSLLRMLTEAGAKLLWEVYRTRLWNCGTISAYVHSPKHETPPPTDSNFGKFFLISERDYLEGLLDDLLWFLKPQEGCGVQNKDVNIKNYADLSGIYPIRNIAYVFWEIVVNPPSV